MGRGGVKSKDKILKLGVTEGDELESDLEGDVNRVGDVDLTLYDEEEHLGYNILGKKVERVLPRESALNNFLKSTSDDEWRVITDQKNQTKYRLTDRDLEIIKRIREGRLGVTQDLNEEDFQVEYDFSEGFMPLRHARAQKGSFVPGSGEEKKINKLVALIKKGLFTPLSHTRASSRTNEPVDIWKNNITSALDNKGSIIHSTPPPPKKALPTHRESYNPSSEYLLTPEELAEWEEQHPDDRLFDFIPKSYSSFRHIEGYAKIYKESFNRCLDLYLCPRALRSNWINDSRELLPKIPSLNQFMPFPQRVGIVVKDHGSDVMSLHFDKGILAAGYRDGSLAIHNIASKPFYLPEFYPHTISKGIANSVQTITLHNKLPLLIFSRAQYLFICLIRKPQTSQVELKDLLKKYWYNPQDQMDGDEEGGFKIPKNLHQYIEAIDAMRSLDSTVPECSESNRPQKIGQWRSFKSKTYFDDIKQQATLGDDDGTILTSGSEGESESESEEAGASLTTSRKGHADLIHKDWLEIMKFIDLLKTQNKYIIAGYVISLGVKPSSVSVHSKGAYVATSAPSAPNPSSQCLLHHLKKKRSLAPLRKLSKYGVVESVAFHPVKTNLLIIGFPKISCVYDLQPQTPIHIATKTQSESSKSQAKIVQKFKGSDNSTSMEILHDHSSDNTHIIRVTTDGKFQWFDCDYGPTPYKTIEVIQGEQEQELSGRTSLISVKCHPNLPLIAAGTSETHIQLFHAAPDELTEMQIHPLIKLSDKESHVTALAWNPQNHWLASGHSNGRIIIWI